MILKKGDWIIIASFIVAMMLTVIPLPDWAINWRPEWIVIVLIYWCMAIPERVGIVIGWCSGLVLDVQQGALLGLNALGLAFIAYLTIRYHRRLRVFSLSRQAVFVCFYILLYELALFVIGNYIGNNGHDWTSWMSAFTSMLLWPWSFIILRDIRRKYHIS